MYTAAQLVMMAQIQVQNVQIPCMHDFSLMQMQKAIRNRLHRQKQMSNYLIQLTELTGNTYKK